MLTVPGSAPVVRRRSGTPGGTSIDDTFLASMIFDTPTKSSTPSSSLQKSPHHKSTSALNDVSTSSSHAHSHAPTNIESSSYLANLTSGYADEFDMSPTSSVVSGHSNVFSKPANHHSNQGPRDFDLADDILQHFSIKSGRSSGVSPHKVVDIPATSSPVTRYKRSSSPAIMLEGAHDRSVSPLQQDTAHSYQPPSHLQRPSHHHAHSAGRPQQQQQPQKLLYDNEAAAKNCPPRTSQGGVSKSKIPVPVGSRPSNPSESYDLQEMLQVWEKSNKNPFGEGTLV